MMVLGMTLVSVGLPSVWLCLLVSCMSIVAFSSMRLFSMVAIFLLTIVGGLTLELIVAMFREYDMLNKFTVECAVYSSGVSRLPICILRYDIIHEQLFVQRFAASNLRIYNEVHHFLTFLENPHWRDTVKHIQYRNGNLFESSDY